MDFESDCPRPGSGLGPAAGQHWEGTTPPVRAARERGRAACAFAVNWARKKKVVTYLPPSMPFWGTNLTCAGPRAAGI